MKLNPSKTSEIVFSKRGSPEPPPNSGIQRFDTIKVLGIHIDNRLTFNHHVDDILGSCNQSLYALKTMRNYGLDQLNLQTIFKYLILSRLLSASVAWWGFCGQQNRHRLSAFLRKSEKYGYYDCNEPDLIQIQEQTERKLFTTIISNDRHVFHDLLPPLKASTYSLRPRGHNFSFPSKDDRNFLVRCLYTYI